KGNMAFSWRQMKGVRMSDETEPGLTVISGEVLEMSPSDARNQKTRRYPFILLKTEQGEVVRIHNLLTDTHTDQQIAVGLKTTLHLLPVKWPFGNPKNINMAIGAQSANGTGIAEIT